MSFIKTLPIALLIFSVIVIGLYASTSDVVGQGFWTVYSYTPPSNNITGRFNLISNISKSFGTDVACDVNPEDASCTNKQKSLEDGDLVSRLVLGVAGGLTTIYKGFFLPKYLLIEVSKTLGIPTLFVDVGYTIVFIVLLISIVLLIFTRSDT